MRGEGAARSWLTSDIDFKQKNCFLSADAEVRSQFNDDERRIIEKREGFGVRFKNNVYLCTAKRHDILYETND